MRVGILFITIRVSWVHSLKEKRMEVKSLIAKIKNKFNVSIIEADCQDIHQTIVLGLSSVATDSKGVDKTLDLVLDFIECNSNGMVINIEREFY